jgi:hypothetical protein
MRLPQTTALNSDPYLYRMPRCNPPSAELKPICFFSLILSVTIATWHTVYGYAYMDVNVHFHSHICSCSFRISEHNLCLTR